LKTVYLYFQIHQPYRLNEYSFFQIGKSHQYENQELNTQVFEKVSKNCYLKANQLFEGLLKKFPNDFALNFGITGTFLEQLNSSNDTLQSFQELFKQANIDILGETYYHSLSYKFDLEEFKYQVLKHQSTIKNMFDIDVKVFRNTELIYNNAIADYVSKLGFEAILTEGVDRILKDKSPNQIFRSAGLGNMLVFARNYKLSDDIAFRFAEEKELDIEKRVSLYLTKVNDALEYNDVVSIFMDYETIGEHQKEEDGIFDFFEQFICGAIEKYGIKFKTFKESLKTDKFPLHIFDCEETISWADTERDLSAWFSNSMQYESLKKIFELKPKVLSTNNQKLIEQWRRLQTSDHFYYMCTKYWADGDVHKYFSPFKSPYDAYIYYMNVISDLEIVLKKI
jgi:alpha-amylase